jgi:cytochrome c556
MLMVMQTWTFSLRATTTESFWTANKKDDAVTMLKDSIAKVTAVEQALNAPMPDQQAVLGAFKQVGATCAACISQWTT